MIQIRTNVKIKNDAVLVMTPSIKNIVEHTEQISSIMFTVIKLRHL